MSAETLASQWLAAKEAERVATERRRAIEDQLIEIVKTKPEGSATTDLEGLQVKVTTRMTRKVDADLVQELAAENGLTNHLSSLFRWSPSINMAAWKSADSTITTPLLDAITTTAGRPSFNITRK